MDTDHQIRLNFLEESVEYFEQMEQVLLGLDTAENKPQQMDIALRAAHSIKGSAGMMGFVSMAQVAHRLEDSFKILRARQIQLDPELETLLLRGVDCLKEVREQLCLEQPVDEDWLSIHAEPIFEQLRDRLGELSEADEDQLLTGEEEIDVALLIFSNGVEESLSALEAEATDLSGEALRQRLLLAASQLSNLGLMGDIEAFVLLCESIQSQAEALDSAQIETQIRPLCEQAIQTWRRSQSLVQLGRLDSLPTQITLATPTAEQAFAAPESAAFEHSFQAAALFETEMPEIDLSELQAMQAEMAKVLGDPAIADVSAFLGTLDQSSILDSALALSSNFPSADPGAELGQNGMEALAIEAIEAIEGIEGLAQLQDAIAQLDLSTFDLGQVNSAPHEIQSVDNAATGDGLRPAPKTRSLAQAEREPQQEPNSKRRSNDIKAAPARAATLRIAAEDLNQINTLFSTLILERNVINLRQQQLTDFVQLLQERMRSLESFNLRLRQWYDRASMEGLVQRNSGVHASISGGTTTIQTIQPVHANHSTSTNSTGFDSLEMDQYSDLHLMAQEQMETVVQLQEVTADIVLGLQDMGLATQKLNGTTRGLQSRITRTQMRPFSEIVGQFPRVIRDLSLQYNKKVNLRIEGEATLFERVALDALSDPLKHLLRNCFDHGIEPAEDRLAANKSAEGTITIRASQLGNQAQITIVDDGRGIDLDKIRAKMRKHDIPEQQIAQMSDRDLLSLIFDAGFSTAEKVTELSGRGVGMDVVRANIEKLKGNIQVKSEFGQGTTFTITLPLGLSVLRVILLEHQKLIFAVPVESITEMLVCRPETIRCSPPPALQPYLLWNDQQVPITVLSDSLSFRGTGESTPLEGNPSINQPLIIVIQDAGHYHAVPVDRFWNEQEVAIRPVMSPMPLPAGFSGATVLGDGRVIPLVSLAQIIRAAAEQRDSSSATAAIDTPTSSASQLEISEASARQVVLVIDDSVHVRRYLTLTLERAGYEVVQAKDGQEGVDKLLGGLKVQAVLCDVEMPRLDGYGVLDEIKGRPEFAKLPITMLTSRNSDKHRKLALSLGASAYFPKPYNDQELLKSLEDLITISLL